MAQITKSKRNWVQLYKTYQKRRERLYESGKVIEDQLSFTLFRNLYNNMEQQYREEGRKNPTKNIIQNMTNHEIYYDTSFKQAKAMKAYFKNNVEVLEHKEFLDLRTGTLIRADKVTIYQLRHSTEIFGKDVTNTLIKESYNQLKEEHPEWFSGHRTIEAKKRISEIFFGGDSEKGRG